MRMIHTQTFFSSFLKNFLTEDNIPFIFLDYYYYFTTFSIVHQSFSRIKPRFDFLQKKEYKETRKFTRKEVRALKKTGKKRVPKRIASGKINDKGKASTFGSCKNTRVLVKE